LFFFVSIRVCLLNKGKGFNLTGVLVTSRHRTRGEEGVKGGEFADRAALVEVGVEVVLFF